MRTILIIVILAAAAVAAWFLLSNAGGDDGNSDAEAAQAALDQIGLNQLKELDQKNQNSFYEDEYDDCVKACKQSNCKWWERKCKGRCKTDCLKQKQARYGLEPLYTSSAPPDALTQLYQNQGIIPIKKPGQVREYNPLAG